MAVPRVFVSSTCYDLTEVRDSLVGFCQALGFDSSLSDRGDVFYHPDLHTHESCIGEVGNCHLLILIIGGRFGGEYISDKTKSITNAEYSAAREQNIPVFTFVKQDVLNDHNLWQRNKDKLITYPSIEKQEHAVDIFNFVDTVRRSSVNNGFFGFRYAKEMQDLLRKQIAGMFFDFLTKRNVSKQIQTTADAVNNLTVVSTKIEELVKSMYLNVTNGSATTAIQEIDAEAAAEFFFVEIARLTNDKELIVKVCGKEIAANTPMRWQDALLTGSLFRYGFDEERPKRLETAEQRIPGDKVLTYLGFHAITDNDGVVLDKDAETQQRLESAWSIFRSLSKPTKERILSKYAYQPKSASTSVEKQPKVQ